MKLKHFLDAAYAMLADEYQRLGMNLFEATEKLVEWSAGYKPSEGLPVAVAIEEDQAARQNERSLAELQARMAGLG